MDKETVQSIYSLVVVEPSLIKSDYSIKEESKFDLGKGYKDTYASIYKMADLSVDIQLSKA